MQAVFHPDNFLSRFSNGGTHSFNWIAITIGVKLILAEGKLFIWISYYPYITDILCLLDLLISLKGELTRKINLTSHESIWSINT